MKKGWFVLLMCLITMPVFSQKKLAFGIIVSAYKANNFSAIQYDGSQQYGIDWIIKDPFYQNKLIQLFNGNTPVIVEYPDKMEYRINAAIGANSIYQINDELGIKAELYFTRLTVFDQMTFGTPNTDPNNTLEPYNYHAADVVGKEQRMIVKLGIRKLLSVVGEYPRSNFGIGILMNSTKAQEKYFTAQGERFNFLFNAQNLSSLSSDRQGTGYGAYSEMSFQWKGGEKLYPELFGAVNYQKTPLGPEDSRKFKFDFELGIRLIYK